MTKIGNQKGINNDKKFFHVQINNNCDVETKMLTPN